MSDSLCEHRRLLAQVKPDGEQTRHGTENVLDTMSERLEVISDRMNIVSVTRHSDQRRIPGCL
jgi:hypothetical protein